MGKRGPPPKKGATLGARITIDTRKKLEAAKRASGLSLSEEAENRLARSLSEEKETEHWILQILRECMRAADMFTGRSWLEDPFTFDAMVSVITKLLVAFRPGGEVAMPETTTVLTGLAGAPPQIREEMTAKLKALPPQTFAHSIAGGLLIALQQRGFGRPLKQREMFAKAADYLEGLLTDPPLKPIATSEEKPS